MSQRKLGNKFNKHHMTISRQIKKWGIEDHAREKTPKYTEEQAVKAKKLANLLYQSKAEIIMDDEKYFCLNGVTCPWMRAITRMTNQNVQTMFALLEKINILKKY